MSLSSDTPYQSYPPSLYRKPTIPASGATAGTPGTFTPAGAAPPANYAALTASGITGTPATAWTGGAYVVLGDGSQAHWSGTAWVAGPAPALDEGSEGNPAAIDPGAHPAPKRKAPNG